MFWKRPTPTPAVVDPTWANRVEVFLSALLSPPDPLDDRDRIVLPLQTRIVAQHLLNEAPATAQRREALAQKLSR